MKKSKRELKEIKEAEEGGDMWRRYDYSFANFLAQHSTADEVEQIGSEIFNPDPDFSGQPEKSAMFNKISVTISRDKKNSDLQEEYMSKNVSRDFHLKIEEKSPLKPYLDFLEDFENNYEKNKPFEPNLDLLENFEEEFKDNNPFKPNLDFLENFKEIYEKNNPFEPNLNMLENFEEEFKDNNPFKPNSEFIDRFDKEFEEYNSLNTLKSWLPDKFEWEVDPFEKPDEWLALVINNKQTKEKLIAKKEETKQPHFPESTIQEMQKSSSELKEKGNIKQNLDGKTKISENNNQTTHKN